MWSGALADPEHCPYCQCTAVAQAGKTLTTFKGYLSWEKVNIHFHNLPGTQKNTQNVYPMMVWSLNLAKHLVVHLTLHFKADLGSIDESIKKQNQQGFQSIFTQLRLKYWSNTLEIAD